MSGVGLRVATAEDMENYGNNIAVSEAIARFNDADAVAEATKREARLEVTEWLNENCETAEDLQDFLTNDRQNLRVILSWIRRAHADDDYEVGDSLKHAYANLAYGKLKQDEQRKTSPKKYFEGLYNKQSTEGTDR